MFVISVFDPLFAYVSCLPSSNHLIGLCYFMRQVVSQYSSVLSPICVDAVLKVIDPSKDTNVDLRDIKIIKKLGFV